MKKYIWMVRKQYLQKVWNPLKNIVRINIKTYIKTLFQRLGFLKSFKNLQHKGCLTCKTFKNLWRFLKTFEKHCWKKYKNLCKNIILKVGISKILQKPSKWRFLNLQNLWKSSFHRLWFLKSFRKLWIESYLRHSGNLIKCLLT